MSLCPGCQGQKKVRQLGMMHADCPMCDASGSISSAKFEEYRKTLQANPPKALIPLSLPDDFYDKQKVDEREKMRNANVAHLNRPIEIKQNPSTGASESGGIGTKEKTVAPGMDAKATAAAATFEGEGAEAMNAAKRLPQTPVAVSINSQVVASTAPARRKYNKKAEA